MASHNYQIVILPELKNVSILSLNGWVFSSVEAANTFPVFVSQTEKRKVLK